jgi:GT2 family glycosyltransferase
MFNDNLSIISHLYSNILISFELVVLDNGSTDGTVEYLEELSNRKDIVFLQNKTNEGVITGRNKAYLMSKDSNKFICFLDNDQYVQENWLDSYEKCFESGCDVTSIEAWKMRQDYFPLSKITDHNASYQYVGAGGMMVKKKVIDDIGLFDEDFFMYFEDPDFCWRAYDAGYKVGWNNGNVVIHEPHSLLGKEPKRRQYFYDSLKKFQKKWENRELPNLNPSK